MSIQVVDLFCGVGGLTRGLLDSGLNVVGGFDYFDTLFKVGDYYFEATINISNIKKGKLFKDVTKIKDVTEAIMNSYGQSPKFQFLRTSSIDSISQNQKITTGISEKVQNQENEGSEMVHRSTKLYPLPANQRALLL